MFDEKDDPRMSRAFAALLLTLGGALAIQDLVCDKEDTEPVQEKSVVPTLLVKDLEGNLIQRWYDPCKNVIKLPKGFDYKLELHNIPGYCGLRFDTEK